LVWDEERPPENFETLAETNLPVLEPAPPRALVTDRQQPTHVLIEGDNLHALTVLNYTHAQAVDVIYIDPPYNTGSKDFRYNDTYIDGGDGYRHSKWISFMRKRLMRARDLLKDTGIIFISIADNELPQLRLLCDEIFGEENFRNTIVVSRVKKNIRERDLVKALNFGHGTVIFYARSSSAVIRIPTRFQRKKERWHSFDAPGIRKTMQYELFGHKPPAGRHWMYEEGKSKTLIAKGLLRPNPKSGKPEYCLKSSDDTMLDTNWTDLQEGDSKWIPNGGKNVKLVKRIIGMHPNKNAVVLDFFAGSGTTAEAVAALNHEDNGSRQVVLCTNNENEICAKVCYPRVKQVIQGYRRADGKPIAGLGGNLKYYRTAFAPADPGAENKELFTRQSIELLCLRESTFDFVSETEFWKIYENHQRHTAMLFDPAALPDLKKELARLGKPTSVYVFSREDANWECAFADMAEKVKARAIPDTILRAYRRIFFST
jgi:adenine-specific DNA-methyltransferase